MPRLIGAAPDRPVEPRAANRQKLSARLLIILTALSLQAFALHEVDEDPSPGLALPPTYARADSLERAPSLDSWWAEFKDPQLDSLVQEALHGNFDLRATWARLRQALQLVEQADAALLPEISVSGDINRSRQVFGQGAFGNTIFLATRYSLQASTSYELDLWQRILSLRSATLQETQASSFELEASAQSLVGLLVEAWLNALERQAQLALLDAQEQTNRDFLELTELRFARAEASALDVLQQRQQLAAVRAQRPQVQAQLQLFEHQLAALLGRVPGALQISARALPKRPSAPLLGSPQDLLLRRPDLAAAKARLIAADHRVTSAIADRLPALRLSAQAGFSAFDRARLFDEIVGSIGAALAGPLFDAGRRAAAVEQQRARVLELAQLFAAQLLDALVEVEDALTQERGAQATWQALGEQLELARRSLASARERYQRGLSDYLNVLTALSSTQLLERQMLSAERDALLARARLYRALGGRWSRDLSDPLPGEPVQLQDARS